MTGPPWLLDAAGQSTSTGLNRLQYGTSPMQLLRDMRLDKIRLELANAPADASVSEIALHWGYTHLGRFAAYRQRFGEAPSQTLAAARGSASRSATQTIA